MRDELQLSPGDSLELESSEERIVLRPARGRGQMRKESGVWVFDSGEVLSEQTVRKTLRKVREQIVREERSRQQKQRREHHHRGVGGQICPFVAEHHEDHADPGAWSTLPATGAGRAPIKARTVRHRP